MKDRNSIPADTRSIMWVMATLALALTIQLWRMPIWLLIVTLAPFGWRLWSEKKGLKPLPTVIRVVALGVALLMLVLSYGNVFGRTAAVSLLAVMLSLKLLETYYVRDARVVVSFSMFLCATQFLFAQGVLMPIYGAVVVAAALISMAHLHRRESFIESGKAPRLGRSVFSELGFSFRILLLALPAALALAVLCGVCQKPALMPAAACLTVWPRDQYSSFSWMIQRRSESNFMGLFRHNKSFTGVVRCCGSLMGENGSPISGVAISRRANDLQIATRIIATPFSLSPTSVGGCSPWTTLRWCRRTAG
jgi:hypothetical protein